MVRFPNQARGWSDSGNRRAWFLITLCLFVASFALGPNGANIARAAACLRPPVDAPVSRPFDAPPCPWCAGHRGLSYAVAAGTPVRAAAAGTVTFSGVVVDVRYVVVQHADGLLATYGGLESSPVTEGQTIIAGATIGRSDTELYFGLRTGPDAYIDPQPLMGELVVPPYLVPTDGSPPRPPPEAVLRCGGAEGAGGFGRGDVTVALLPEAPARLPSRRASNRAGGPSQNHAVAAQTDQAQGICWPARLVRRPINRWVAT